MNVVLEIRDFSEDGLGQMMAVAISENAVQAVFQGTDEEIHEWVSENEYNVTDSYFVG